MPLARCVALLGLLAVSVGVRADFVLRTFNCVVRYSDSGDRLIEYGGGDTSAANGGFWLGESVDGIAVSNDGHVYAVTNNLGSRSLIRFDLDTGAVVPRPDLIPTGEFWSDAPLWTSPYVSPEVRCATGGCSGYAGVFQAAARSLGELLVHPDGNLYATGIADLWIGVPGVGTFFESRPALVRFDGDALDAPSVVSILPADVSYNPGRPYFPYYYAQLSLRGDNSIQIATQRGAYGVDVAGFGGETLPASLLASPDPALTDGLDLSGLGGHLGEAFADYSGGIYVPQSVAAGGDVIARLHKFEASTGAYLGVMFEENLPFSFAGPEYSFDSGVYVGVPEPSSVLLSLVAIAGVAAGRRGS